RAGHVAARGRPRRADGPPRRRRRPRRRPLGPAGGARRGERGARRLPRRRLPRRELIGVSGEVEAFRAEAVAFLAEAQAAGIACPAYGAILPPALHDRARAWQRHLAGAGFAGLHWPVEHGGRGLSRAHTAVWMEECARAQVSPYLNLQG